MHEDVAEALRASAEPPRRDLASALVRPLALALVPLGVALLAAMVHRDYEALVWPPSPVLLLAPALSYFVMRRVTTSGAEAGLTAGMSALFALLASWVIALVLGFFAALACLQPNGGCLPW